MSVDFDGDTYDHDLDFLRLKRQLDRVFYVMSDGNWRTLPAIAKVTRGSEASVSARLRDFRKPKFGEHQVNRRARGDRKKGLFEYQLIVNREVPADTGDGGDTLD